MKTLENFNVRDKRILMRCDFNVPLDDQGNILDDFRISQTIPTIRYLIGKGAKAILMSHLDDPHGKVVESLRLDLIQKRLIEQLGLSVTKVQDCIGKKIEQSTLDMKSGEILLLENLRFHKEEEEGNLEFAEELAKLGDIYINDAFGACHRSHASITGVPRYLPSGVGILLEKEIEILRKITDKPEKPMIAIIGGKKVGTKAKLIDRISEVADNILIGGLLKKEIEEKKIALKYPQKIIGPLGKLDSLDINPETVNLFKEKIAIARTIFWNGPLGKIEDSKFAQGTTEIAKAIIESKAFSVVGGGETVEFINKLGLGGKFNHISTGGGAMLAFLSGEELPGLEALR